MLKLTAQEESFSSVVLCSYVWFRHSLSYFYGMISTITACSLIIISFTMKYRLINSLSIMWKISKYLFYICALWSHFQKGSTEYLFKCGIFEFPRALSFLSHHDTEKGSRDFCVISCDLIFAQKGKAWSLSKSLQCRVTSME